MGARPQTAARPEATAGSHPASRPASPAAPSAWRLPADLLPDAESKPAGGHTYDAARGQPPRRDGPSPSGQLWRPPAVTHNPVPLRPAGVQPLLYPRRPVSLPFLRLPRCTCRCPVDLQPSATDPRCVDWRGEGSSEGCRSLVGSMSPESPELGAGTQSEQGESRLCVCVGGSAGTQAPRVRGAERGQLERVSVTPKLMAENSFWNCSLYLF